MKRLIGGVSAFAALTMIVVLGLGFAQSLHPAFDSFSHFRMNFAVVLILLVPVLWLSGRKPIALASAAVCAVVAMVMLPYLPGLQRGFALPKQTKDWHRISITQYNMRFNNTDTDRIVSALNSDPSDVLLLQELTTKNSAVLAAFSQSHPHQLECHSRGVGSVAILSKFPILDNQQKRCIRFEGFASATLLVGDKKINVASFHSRWPWPAGQEYQIERLKPEFENLNTGASILAGDFNAAPWSMALQNISKYSGLQLPTGLKLTWGPKMRDTSAFSKHIQGGSHTIAKAQFPDWFVKLQNQFGPVLPLDHILHSSSLSPLSRDVLEDGGSDHLPVRTVFVWK